MTRLKITAILVASVLLLGGCGGAAGKLQNQITNQTGQSVNAGSNTTVEEQKTGKDLDSLDQLLNSLSDEDKDDVK